ncbi:hypothetical protein DPMN_003197 [Dreissena polymorpha]|uniref:Uncharacterized protein n=1 Tax=Dreissena polymorpha TaxID=45954 RepID=A0A9D4MNE8_DREPO|nr:hypothetical protein DPMN_003197 [Dreissena polymorpha]
MDSNQPSVPVANSLARQANRAREKIRPKPPTDLNFAIDMDFLKCPEFLVADVYCGTATHKQLVLLSSCKRWFLDATFSVLGDPFASGQLEATANGVHPHVQEAHRGLRESFHRSERCPCIRERRELLYRL